MSNVVDLFDKFKSVIELKEYATTLFQGLKRATELLQTKEAEILHLQNLLSRSVPLLDTVRVVKSTEELIVEAEIEKLREVSMSRPLNLNETKQLDMYIKGLKIIRGETPLDGNPKPKPKATEAELLQLALSESNGE